MSTEPRAAEEPGPAVAAARPDPATPPSEPDPHEAAIDGHGSDHDGNGTDQDPDPASGPTWPPSAERVADPCPRCSQEVGEAWLVCAWCGEQIAAPAELEVGSRLGDGRYQVLGVLGRGGFGITYEAGDRRLQRRVAIKELFPESAIRHGSRVLTPPHGRAAFRNARDRFLREARVLARFTHPGIVRVYEVFEEHGTAYLVMELLDGQTLIDILRHRGHPFNEAEVLDVAGRVAAALRPVHVAGVLHRDINPSNVVLTSHGRIVVIDFGLARNFDQSQTEGMTRVVTPGYAPLEQYRGEGRFGPPTDVYGLAATCYRLATGRVPVSAVARDTGAELPSVHDLNPAIPKAVSDALGDGLELDPGHRPQDLDALLARLGVRRLPDSPRSILLGSPGTGVADREKRFRVAGGTPVAPQRPAVSGAPPGGPAASPPPQRSAGPGARPSRLAALPPSQRSAGPGARPSRLAALPPSQCSAGPGTVPPGGPAASPPPEHPAGAGTEPPNDPAAAAPTSAGTARPGGSPTAVAAPAPPPAQAAPPVAPPRVVDADATRLTGAAAARAAATTGFAPPRQPGPDATSRADVPATSVAAAAPLTSEAQIRTGRAPTQTSPEEAPTRLAGWPVTSDRTTLAGTARASGPDGTRIIATPSPPSAAGPPALPPLTADVVGRRHGAHLPLAVGPRPTGRGKVTVPLAVLALATATAAPVVVTAVVVVVALPLLATAGDSVAHCVRSGHGVGRGWAESRYSAGALAPARFGRNLVMSLLRALPMLTVGGALLASWYALSRTSVSQVIVDLVLRGIGVLVMGGLVATARHGSAWFRTGLGLDAVAARLVPDGRTNERLVIFWLVAALVVAGALWLAPDPFPLH